MTCGRAVAACSVSSESGGGWGRSRARSDETSLVREPVLALALEVARRGRGRVRACSTGSGDVHEKTCLTAPHRRWPAVLREGGRLIGPVRPPPNKGLQPAGRGTSLRSPAHPAAHRQSLGGQAVLSGGLGQRGPGDSRPSSESARSRSGTAHGPRWVSTSDYGMISNMLVREQIERAVGLQAHGYQLLKWLEKSLNGGLILPEVVHAYATMEDSVQAWIERHYTTLPSLARPARDDLCAFSKLFFTYLASTFDLEAKPGERLFSPGAHCFCPMCSWMVRVPHLKPKKVSTADKKVADKMRRAFIRDLAAEIGAPATEESLEHMLEDPRLREAIGLCTYAHDLLRRLDGVAVGHASLVLWRSFAWTPKGSPKKGFILSTDAIMEAQEYLVKWLMRGPTAPIERG